MFLSQQFTESSGRDASARVTEEAAVARRHESAAAIVDGDGAADTQEAGALARPWPRRGRWVVRISDGAVLHATVGVTTVVRRASWLARRLAFYRANGARSRRGATRPGLRPRSGNQLSAAVASKIAELKTLAQAGYMLALVER
jgi:hypothetical protein